MILTKRGTRFIECGPPRSEEKIDQEATEKIGVMNMETSGVRHPETCSIYTFSKWQS